MWPILTVLMTFLLAGMPMFETDSRCLITAWLLLHASGGSKLATTFMVLNVALVHTVLPCTTHIT